METEPIERTGVDKVRARQNYPFGMFAVPMDEIVRIHASSGTTRVRIVASGTVERSRGKAKRVIDRRLKL